MRKKISKVIFVLIGAMLGFSVQAQSQPQQVYACGPFCGWDTSECIPFSKQDGKFVLQLDFSQNSIFKITTSDMSDAPSGPEGWRIFDENAVIVKGETKLNTVLPLEPGASNIVAPVAKTLTLIVDPANMTLVFWDGGEIITPEPEPEPQPIDNCSRTLPVMYINTEGGKEIVSKEDYLKGTYWLDPCGVEGIEAFGSEAEPLPLQIKGRGNYSWTGFHKKPYRLKLDAKAGLLGMKKSKHFALLAHADDPNGFLRNTVGFKLSEMIGMNWTPAQQPVEVILNGEYIGLYMLTETIRVDKDRVNIVEQKDNITDPEAVTGGWLVEIDNYDTDPHITVYEGDGNPIWFTYKTPEELSGEQTNYLQSEMERLNRLIYGNKQSDELWSHVDIDQLARYYIVQEVVDDYESFHGSCYLYKDLGADAKWTFGPVWDFGNAFVYDKSNFIFQDRLWHQVWIGEIYKFPRFQEKVKELWSQFQNSNFSDIYGYIDTFAGYIDEGAKADYKRWPSYGTNKEMEKAAYVKEYLRNSVKWLNREWEYSGINNVVSNSKPTVAIMDGRLAITAPKAQTITIAGIDGRAIRTCLHEGTNYIDLNPGFYVVDGHKILITK